MILDADSSIVKVGAPCLVQIVEPLYYIRLLFPSFFGFKAVAAQIANLTSLFFVDFSNFLVP
jgi:hypothetical protein